MEHLRFLNLPCAIALLVFVTFRSGLTKVKLKGREIVAQTAREATLFVPFFMRTWYDDVRDGGHTL